MKSPSKGTKIIEYGKVRLCKRKISINEDDSPRKDDDRLVEDLNESFVKHLNDSISRDFIEEEEELEISFSSLNITNGNEKEKETPARKVSALSQLCKQVIDEEKSGVNKGKPNFTFSDIFSKQIKNLKKGGCCLPTLESFAPYLPNINTSVVWRPQPNEEQQVNDILLNMRETERVQQQESEPQAENLEIYECDACLELFNSKSTYNEHIKKTKSDFIHKIWSM